jgi:hypothetical protein
MLTRAAMVLVGGRSSFAGVLGSAKGCDLAPGVRKRTLVATEVSFMVLDVQGGSISQVNYATAFEGRSGRRQ